MANIQGQYRAYSWTIEAVNNAFAEAAADVRAINTAMGTSPTDNASAITQLERSISVLQAAQAAFVSFHTHGDTHDDSSSDPIPSISAKEDKANKNISNGYVGLSLLKINFKNALNTFTSFFTNSNTAARTYTFQDRNGVIADDTDLAAKENLLVNSAGLRAALNDETGTGAAVFATSPALTTPTGILGSDITLNRVAGSTYSTVQHWRNNLSSSGVVSGGVISDVGSGNINVTGGQGILRSSDSNTAALYFVDWAALNGTNIPADVIRYVGVEWNAGAPQVTVRTTDVWNYHTDFPLGIVINEGGTILHLSVGDKHLVSDMPTHVMERFEHTHPNARDIKTGGLVLGETGTRNITLTAGRVWQKLTEFSIAAFNSAVSGSFSAYYRNGGSGYTKQSGLTQWPNTLYDDNSGVLATLGASKYACLWFYVEPDDSDVVMIYGRAQYSNLASAETESPPSTVPNRVLEGCMLLGRLIFQKSAATASSISSAFDIVFTPVSTSNHATLSNLDFSVAGHTGALPVANGGTNLSAVGAESTVLTVSAGVPAWVAPAGMNNSATAMAWMYAA